ncbi:MAG TPA: RDD family protein [Acidimicrobiia bacterium]|nr:RDD family protein [Acidimicrobiia bacterium]
MTTPPQFPTEQPQGTPANLAQWGTRAIGLLIDYLPAFILQAVFYPIGGLRYLASVAAFLYVYLYLGYFDGLTGQTPGKAIMGTRVVNVQGELIGTGNGIARKFAHILDSIVCLIGWFLPLFDAKRQTIADKVMNTYVVEGVEKKAFSVDLWMPPKT